jgi:aminoglycoside 6'-N-acetyltransferase I
MTFVVREAQRSDRSALARMSHALWPDGSIEEHDHDVVRAFDGSFSSLPFAIFVALVEDEIVGFVEVGLRSHADGCDPMRAVGFIEGWYVLEPHRRRGVGRALLAAAEKWARDQGCAEIASDALIDNEISQDAHQSAGYEIVDRCVHYRKALQ